MRIELDKSYLTRDGRIADIKEFTHSGKFIGILRDSGEKIGYTVFGEIEPNAISSRDLVSLAFDDPAPSKAASDKVGTGLTLIPLYSLLDLGKIFIEGLRYGRDNWKKGVNDKEYQEERLEHAILHLIKYKEGDRSEEHLAKVSWFCFTQLELERLENDTNMV